MENTDLKESRECKKCKEVKVLNRKFFRPVRNKTDKAETWFIHTCKECEKIKRQQPKEAAQQRETARKWYSNNLERLMHKRARFRARDRGILFNIKISDIIIPETCPLLGIKIEQSFGGANDASPSLDQIIPGLGYTKDNIAVISRMANIMKAHATKEQLETFSKNILKYINNDKQR